MDHPRLTPPAGEAAPRVIGDALLRGKEARCRWFRLEISSAEAQYYVLIELGKTASSVPSLRGAYTRGRRA
jgi:hypothetical protein